MIAEDGLGGWTVASGEGSDSLSGVEIIDGSEAGRFLLVGNGGFADFAAAYAEAADGDTIVLAGNASYTAGFAIAKAITISGVNYNTAGTGSRAAESVLSGEWSVNAAAAVVIEGVRFLNDATTTGNGIATLTLASSATVQNSVFFSTELGGAPVSASDDRAIKVTATTGAVSILNNLITGDEIGKFGDASWGRGAITWGGGSTLNVQDNRIEYARTAMELTGSNTLLTLDDNIIFHSGSGLSTTGFSGNVTQITDTQFINVDTDWNDRFNSAANNVTWDFGAPAIRPITGSASWRGAAPTPSPARPARTPSSPIRGTTLFTAKRTTTRSSSTPIPVPIGRRRFGIRRARHADRVERQHFGLQRQHARSGRLR